MARRLAFGFAAVGLAMVAASSVCVTYAFGERTGLGFWLVVIPLALVPYAVTAVAVGRVRGGWWAPRLVGLGAVLVVAAGPCCSRPSPTKPSSVRALARCWR